ncbi:MAG: PIN domain-containing protein [Flavobacteriales bacterium]|nr:PIN domain-containing protein [Flavobacteriales bacterium]
MGNTTFDGVLLDTSFIIRLLKTDDPLHGNTKAWFRWLLDHKVPMHLSTISISEFCVKGSFDQLPLRNVRVLTFNWQHAQRSGEFARNLLDQRKDEERAVVINDLKLLAQADVEPRLSHFLTKDQRINAKITQLSAAGVQLRTTVLDLNIPLAEVLGLLNFPEQE